MERRGSELGLHATQSATEVREKSRENLLHALYRFWHAEMGRITTPRTKITNASMTEEALEPSTTRTRAEALGHCVWGPRAVIAARARASEGATNLHSLHLSPADPQQNVFNGISSSLYLCSRGIYKGDAK
ncbi:hypothetical protein MPTK1_6g00810 [Marchantia polymorpha subsp. ruderalis]|uniref:Uncharacterized protein n=2 Tax=Marchantia polymorpha TaxID=3197 RepID=A0AAF6BM68_MARPO|nr:hypothetical protein MARPO_0052s0119 [Marchantia polymorpha]BBN13102.1 hypothetical protein Mp_6g00810 [Marchantia polymorpha subsp. ruderalis]|eukprot:PTQ38345.1 hypothetical protein MARPO_0052s0119 [Marchantia polymorpha]